MGLVELLMVAGHTVKPYKPMNQSDMVISVEVKKPLEFALDVVEAFVMMEEKLDISIAEVLRSASMDGYGSGYMIYWREDPYEEGTR